MAALGSRRVGRFTMVLSVWMDVRKIGGRGGGGFLFSSSVCVCVCVSPPMRARVDPVGSFGSIKRALCAQNTATTCRVIPLVRFKDVTRLFDFSMAAHFGPTFPSHRGSQMVDSWKDYFFLRSGAFCTRWKEINYAFSFVWSIIRRFFFLVAPARVLWARVHLVCQLIVHHSILRV